MLPRRSRFRGRTAVPFPAPVRGGDIALTSVPLTWTTLVQESAAGEPAVVMVMGADGGPNPVPVKVVSTPPLVVPVSSGDADTMAGGAYDRSFSPMVSVCCVFSPFLAVTMTARLAPTLADIEGTQTMEVAVQVEGAQSWPATVTC